MTFDPRGWGGLGGTRSHRPPPSGEPPPPQPSVPKLGGAPRSGCGVRKSMEV